MLGLLPRKTSSSRLCGEGMISEIVYPGKEWRVDFQATYWTARSACSMTCEPGDFVRVVGIDTENIMLLIEPI